MGNVIWMDICDRPGSETHNDMGVLHRLDKQLGALAEKLGVTKITSFYDYRELIRAEGGDEDLPDPVWFDSAVGLATFKAMRLCLEANWEALAWSPNESQRHWPQSLMDDLRSCESLLEDAVSNGQTFRLLIVP